MQNIAENLCNCQFVAISLHLVIKTKCTVKGEGDSYGCPIHDVPHQNIGANLCNCQSDVI